MTPSVESAPDHESALSHLLTAAEAAVVDGSRQLALALQTAAGALVCGADLQQAQQSIFAEYVASQLQVQVSSEEALLRQRTSTLQPLQIAQNGSTGAKRNDDASMSDLLAAWEALPAAETSSALKHMQSCVLHQQLFCASQSGLQQVQRMHLQACMRLHMGVAESAQHQDAGTPPWQQCAVAFVANYLGLPALPPVLGGAGTGAQGGQTRARRQASKVKSVPASVQSWAHQLLVTARAQGCLDVAAVLLRMLAAHTLLPSLQALPAGSNAAGLSSATSEAQALLSLSACAVHAAQAAVPLAVPALDNVATHAAMVQQPELAHVAASEALSLANRSAAMMQHLETSRWQEVDNCSSTTALQHCLANVVGQGLMPHCAIDDIVFCEAGVRGTI